MTADYASSGRQPSDQVNQLGLQSACGLPPSTPSVPQPEG